MSEELKPCPFCGKPAQMVCVTTEYNVSKETYVGSCTDGFCQGTLIPDGNSVFVNSWDEKETATTAWNTRTP